MQINDKLQIFLITYNRLNKLKYTLDELLKSPVKDFDITVLDNASNDGTSELLDEYSTKFRNIRHIRHAVNIGGNANICRAFEMGAVCGKEYFWVLCDDDKYDFSSWSEVEQEIENKTDIICLSDYIFPASEQKNDPAYQFFQLTFVPAGIYRSDIIDGSVLINMYNSIYTMMQQCCPVARVINSKGKISVISKPVVFNGLHFKDAERDNSYNRGASPKKEQLKRCKYNHWIMGYSNILTLLNDNELAKRSFCAAIVYKDIYFTWDNFYYCLNSQFISKGHLNYFFEIFSMLTDDIKHDVFNFQNTNLEIELKNLGFDILFSSKAQKAVCEKLIKNVFSISNAPDGRHKLVRMFGLKLALKR